MMRASSLNRSEWKTVSVIGAAHFYSHFFFTAIPLTFPLLHDAYGIGYTELGIGYAVFSVATLILQTPIGFIVDRYGATWILAGGLFLEAIALMLLGVFQTYGAYLALMGLAGVANAVYHPCDYSVLTKCIRCERLGRAFSIHTFCGTSGSVASPIVIVLVSFGFHWSHAFIVCGAAGIAIALAVALKLRGLATPATEDSKKVETVVQSRSGFRLLFSAPVILGWLFFLGFSMSGSGMYDFSLAAFTEIYDAPIATAGIVIWMFLVAEALGILSAGFFTHRWNRQELVVLNCFSIVAACMFFIAAVPMPLFVLAIPLVIAGCFFGFIAPSRDIIISTIAPSRDMGKVFGVVTTGFNAGGILGPPLFGYLLDLGNPYSIFWGAGIICVLSTFTLFGPSSRKRPVSADPGR